MFTDEPACTEVILKNLNKKCKAGFLPKDLEDRQLSSKTSTLNSCWNCLQRDYWKPLWEWCLCTRCCRKIVF